MVSSNLILVVHALEIFAFTKHVFFCNFKVVDEDSKPAFLLSFMECAHCQTKTTSHQVQGCSQ